MKHVELVEAPGALALDVHALEQVGIALRIENDHDLVVGLFLYSPAPAPSMGGLAPSPHADSRPAAMRSANVLGDEHFRQASLAYPCGAQDQCVAHALTQRETDILLIWFDPVQSGQATHWWERPSGVPVGIPTSEFCDQFQWEGGEL